MKKALLLLIALLFVSGVAIAETPAYRLSPGAGEIKSKHGTEAVPDKTFRLVRYVPATGTLDSASIDAGSVVIWDTQSDDGITVTTTTTSYDSRVAGILVLTTLTPENLANDVTEDVGKRNWGWLQTYGLSRVNIQTDGTATVGAALGTGDTAGDANDYLPSASSSTLNGFAGFFMDSAAANADDVDCFVRCE